MAALSPRQIASQTRVAFACGAGLPPDQRGLERPTTIVNRRSPFFTLAVLKVMLQIANPTRARFRDGLPATNGRHTRLGPQSPADRNRDCGGGHGGCTGPAHRL
jgi:hypothetical protein